MMAKHSPAPPVVARMDQDLDDLQELLERYNPLNFPAGTYSRRVAVATHRNIQAAKSSLLNLHSVVSPQDTL